MIHLQRRVGSEIQSLGGYDRGNATRLLVACEDRRNGLEIARRSQNSALVAIVASKNPQTVFPMVVDDVVYVAHGASGKRVGRLPGSSFILRRIDVDFIPLVVGEVFAEKYAAAR